MAEADRIAELVSAVEEMWSAEWELSESYTEPSAFDDAEDGEADEAAEALQQARAGLTIARQQVIYWAATIAWERKRAER